jgi:hypothetical protein
MIPSTRPWLARTGLATALLLLVACGPGSGPETPADETTGTTGEAPAGADPAPDQGTAGERARAALEAAGGTLGQALGEMGVTTEEAMGTAGASVQQAVDEATKAAREALEAAEAAGTQMLEEGQRALEQTPPSGEEAPPPEPRVQATDAVGSPVFEGLEGPRGRGDTSELQRVPARPRASRSTVVA